MSKTDSLHYQLCLEGAKWLRRQKWNYEYCLKKPCFRPHVCGPACCGRCRYVAVEICTWNSEHTDVWGLGNFSVGTVIEVKTSHADFLSDRKKWCRSDDAAAKGIQAGSFRWYLCPEGIISKEELPEGWGLLYWDGRKINPVVAPRRFDTNSWADLDILMSILKREGFPEKIYSYRGARSTIQPQTINGIPAMDNWKPKAK